MKSEYFLIIALSRYSSRILVVLFFFGVLFDLQDNVGADRRPSPPARSYSRPRPSIPICTPRRLPRGVADYGHDISDHERGVEADAELADDIMAVLAFVLCLKARSRSWR